MKESPVLEVEVLVAIAKIFGDNFRGLSEKEIKYFLNASEIPDVMPMAPKWIRLYNAFSSVQNRLECSNNIIAFIHKIMKPSLYKDTDIVFKWRIANLNPKLKSAGLALDTNGKLTSFQKEESYINKPKFQFTTLYSDLIKRGVHPDIINYCKAIKKFHNNYMIIEAIVELIENRLCDLSGIAAEGEKLIRKALEFDEKNNPLVAINRFLTDHEKAEQIAFINLLIGFVGQVKNTINPRKRILWDIQHLDALEILTIASYILKKIDKTHIYIEFK